MNEFNSEGSVMNPKVSLICCYRNEKAWRRLKVEASRLSSRLVEFIGVDNSKNKFTLPEALNYGKEFAQGELLFFVHDDIVLFKKGWDADLMDFFEKNTDCGVLGFAGGTKAFAAPSTWWTQALENDTFMCMVQTLRDGTEVSYLEFGDAKEVVGLDGFALAVEREVIQGFDWSNEIGEWHGYDLDLCYHSYFIKKKKNYVMPVQMVHHLSMGTVGYEWGQSMINVWNKYHRHLVSQSNKKGDFEALRIFMNWTHKEKLRWSLLKAVARNRFSIRGVCSIFLCFSKLLPLKKLGFKLLDLTVND